MLAIRKPLNPGKPQKAGSLRLSTEQENSTEKNQITTKYDQEIQVRFSLPFGYAQYTLLKRGYYKTVKEVEEKIF